MDESAHRTDPKRLPSYVCHLALAFQLRASTSQKDRGNQPVQWKAQLGPTAYAIDGRLRSPFTARSVNLTDFAHNAGETSQLTRRAFAALQTPSDVLAGGRRTRRRPVARTPTTATTTSTIARPKVQGSVPIPEERLSAA
ncbi:hypothetical protein M422DRAFT_276459 [Sphaerobolus stellatus SS14]|uniref:Uncharacterized protein n=1 Tax=Sphaerobolus stellatus (strain SS14) TaxID=990650 RepID=A0A0C9T2N6_SPHS4|nr:hypothetical protein M422DRAFT_276459 [Sphaerobolus stellatus SS14]